MRSFELAWLLEPLVEHPTYSTKRMFGGLAVYLHGNMVLLLAEDPGTKEYRGTKYKFDIWDGILFPTFREHHESLIKTCPALVQHPVLGKWVYLGQSTKKFEDHAQRLIELVLDKDPRFGIPPKKKKTKKRN